MVLEEGPLKSAFERNTKGVVKQEFITYVVKGNQLVKETVIRKFHSRGDYVDSLSLIHILTLPTKRIV